MEFEIRSLMVETIQRSKDMRGYQSGTYPAGQGSRGSVLGDRNVQPSSFQTLLHTAHPPSIVQN